MGNTRIALAIAVAAVVVAIAILGSSALGGTRTVTSTSTSIIATTSTVTKAASTITDVVVSNHTVTMNVTEGRPYALLINPDATVRGGAASIPGCAVHGGCTSSANQSSTAILILYGGSYYYVSNYTFTGQYNIVYTIWYTNSTEYCISPEVSWDPVCPNAVFIPENPATTQTTQSVSCTATGEGGPLFLEVVTDEGVPVQDQQIQTIHTGPTVDNTPCGTASLPTLSTNSTGWVQVPGGDGLPYAGSFAVSFVYSGQTYNATIAIQPETTTYVTFYVPSGVQATTQCPDNSCPTYTNSMSMDS